MTVRFLCDVPPYLYHAGIPKRGLLLPSSQAHCSVELPTGLGRVGTGAFGHHNFHIYESVLDDGVPSVQKCIK
jgi:hypothetical protein